MGAADDETPPAGGGAGEGSRLRPAAALRRDDPRRAGGRDGAPRAGGRDDPRRVEGQGDARRAAGRADARRAAGQDDRGRSAGDGDGRRPAGHADARRAAGRDDEWHPEGRDGSLRPERRQDSRRPARDGDAGPPEGHGDAQPPEGRDDAPRAGGREVPPPTAPKAPIDAPSDADAPGGGPLWVFAYGSLIWDPGFEPAERRLARLADFRRSFCMRSIHHRGTEAQPGLVLALDFEEGASCRGLALRAAPGEEARVLAMLRERELVSSAYLERAMRVETEAGAVRAIAFVMSREHPQYAGGLPLEVQAAIIARARGGRGPNDAYLHSTVAALEALGIEDAELARLARLVRARRAA